MKGALGIYTVVGLSLAAGGVLLHRRGDVDPASIAGSIHVAALLGAVTGAFSRTSGSTTRRSWVLAALATYLGWRVSFFPVLVLSGHAAAVSEWTVRFFHRTPWTIYPTLLLSVALGTAVTVRLIHAAMVADSRRLRVLCGAPCVAAGLITFTGPGDLDLLPDRTPWSEAPTPAASLPTGNAYQDALDGGHVGPVQRPLVIAAALTYESIPDAPWASHVQGTLEVAFRARPRASSSDRVREHFQAFAAAHRFAPR